MGRLTSGPFELSRREQVLLKAGAMSCLDCGYLAADETFSVGPRHTPHAEVNLEKRKLWKTRQSAGDIKKAHCFCALWSNEGEDALTQLRNISKPRSCTAFFPYSEGPPEGHRDSHRNRTNRRWLVAGTLIGPYLATAVGFVASELSRDSGDAPRFIFAFIAGLVGIAAVALIINRVFIRL